MIELTENITLIELLYFLGGLVGFFYAWNWTRKAEGDKHGLVISKLNGGRMMAAQINAAIGWCMMGKLAIYTSAGMLAMTLPSAGGEATWQSSAIGVGFIIAEYTAVWLLRFINTQYDAMARYYIEQRMTAMEGNQATDRERMDTIEGTAVGHAAQQGVIRPADHADRHTEQEAP